MTDPIVLFLDAWSSLCAPARSSKGRQGITAKDAMAVDGPRSEALDAALLALGYPFALVSPKSLGSTLAQLKGRGGWDGRTLASWHCQRGTVWYVVQGGG